MPSHESCVTASECVLAVPGSGRFGKKHRKRHFARSITGLEMAGISTLLVLCPQIRKRQSKRTDLVVVRVAPATPQSQRKVARHRHEAGEEAFLFGIRVQF